MQTVITNSPIKAAEFIKRGGIVAFPTETVYGLGASVFEVSAIAKVFEAKGRPSDNPLIAHIWRAEQIGELAANVTASAEKFITRFFPGPLTVVLKKRENVPLIATAGLDTIGIRMPQLKVANEFLHVCGVPVVAPSANLSGRPSPTTWEAVFEDLDGRIDCILQGEPTEIGLESTVIDCSNHVPILLRAGSVSLEMLRSVVPETLGLSADIEGVAPRSPGMKHRHYSPRATVILVESKSLLVPIDSAAFIGMRNENFAFAVATICDSVEEYAHEVFEFFRECDRAGIATIYCETVEETGIGAALMDRLRRAAKR